jgi:signal transduction histidine kinase
MPTQAQIAVSLFGIVGAIVLIGALRTGPSMHGGVFFLMAALALVTARAKVKLPGGSTLSLLTSVVLASLMLLGKEAAIIVGVLGVVVQSSFPWSRKVPHRIVFNLGMVGLTVALAGGVYNSIAPHKNPGTSDQLAGILTASFIYYVCNSICVSLIVSLSSGKSVWKLWHSIFLYTAPLFFVEGIVAFGALRLASVLQFGVLAAVVPVSALTYYSIRVYLDSMTKEKRHAEEMSELNETLEKRVVERSESLRVAKELAEQASRAKSAFLANMSHELRTPLNAIIGYSEMLHEDALDEGQTQEVEDLMKIRTAAKHLLSLINDLLDLSKIEAGKVQIHVESFDFLEVLDEVVNAIQPLAKKNRNTLAITTGESIPMMSDRTKICQVLINIASNACKFTEAGIVSIAVSRQSGKQGDFVQIRISDNGIGMEPELLERLFEPFVQADVSTTRKFGGTGLGLAISRKFCHLLHGNIVVNSAPKEGSTFDIVLPTRFPETETPKETAAGGATIAKPSPAPGDSQGQELIATARE